MKNILRKKILSFINTHIQLKLKYLALAQILSDTGICPPLSESPEKMERDWAEQEEENPSRNPYLYLECDDSIELKFKDILQVLDPSHHILEIGCNAGRILDYLYEKGYQRLTGIELCQKSREMMKKNFPEAFATTNYIVGHAYEEIRKLPSNKYDLVFTNGVLVNIAPKWNGIIKEMIRVTKGYVMICENEGSYSSYPRNFKKLYEKYGCKQVLYKFYVTKGENRKTILPRHVTRNDMFKNMTVRVFVKSE